MAILQGQMQEGRTNIRDPRLQIILSALSLLEFLIWPTKKVFLNAWHNQTRDLGVPRRKQEAVPVFKQYEWFSECTGKERTYPCFSLPFMSWECWDRVELLHSAVEILHFKVEVQDCGAGKAVWSSKEHNKFQSRGWSRSIHGPLASGHACTCSLIYFTRSDSGPSSRIDRI